MAKGLDKQKNEKKKGKSLKEKRAEKKEKKKRVKKEAKPKKIQPEHNHVIGEIPTEPCPLCLTHGDVLVPELTNNEFEGEDITERLRAILAEEAESELPVEGVD